MNFPKDIRSYIERHYPEDQRKEVISLLASAVLHDGNPPGDRITRCALFAGRGDLEKLKYYIDLIAIDFRDVIVAGEYELREGKLVQVRDLSGKLPL